MAEQCSVLVRSGSGDESSEDFSGPEPPESVTNFCKYSHLSAVPVPFFRS